MKKYIILIFSLFPLLASSQEGIPFISHFSGPGRNDSQNWSLCQDDHGVMYFANRYGLLTFDGNNWTNVRLPIVPVTLGKDPFTNTIYIGGRGSFGHLNRDAMGSINYTSLSADSTDTGLISNILFTREKIIFSGTDAVFVYIRESGLIESEWFAKKDQAFTGVTYIQNNLFINVTGLGLYRIDSDTLFPIVTGYLTENNEILFSLPYSDDRVLLGTSDNQLALFDGIKYYDFKLSQKNYLNHNILNKGVALGDSLFAFSTLYGGAVIADKRTGKIINTINYQTGLPDDEVYAMGYDNNSGLWLTHSYGISRVDLRLPLSSYSVFPGLEGIPLLTSHFNNRLYVATNTGLYLLDEVKNYEEVEVYYRERQEQKKSAPLDSKQLIEEQETESVKPKRNIFNKLFRKKDDKPEEDLTKDIALKEQKVVEPEPTEPKTILRKRTESKLQSISWIYKKVKGIDTRCTELLVADKKLFAVAGTGIYEITGNKAERIYSGRTINSVLNKGELLIVASDNGLRGIDISSKDKSDKLLFNHNTPIYSLAFANNGELWAGGQNIIYCFEKTEGGRFREKSWYYHDSEFLEQCMIDIVHDTVFHFSESGIYFFSDDAQAFIPWISELTKEKALINEYILEQSNMPWIKNEDEWYMMEWLLDSSHGSQEGIRLFDNIRSLNIDDNNNIWLIDEEKGIYKLNNIGSSGGKDYFNIFFSKVSEEDGKLINISKLVLDEGDRLSINLSAPHYLKETSTEYQYYIEGKFNNWTEWSNNPSIDNIYLVPGDYTIFTRARNILGSITDEKTIFITIKPPFTNSVWFYMIIGLAALLLIWFVTDLRQRKLRHDKKILERKVQERTREIEKKKKKIETQRDKILRQKEEITSSITYARKIQEAILPDHKLLESNFTNYFILYKPRDIVSGDFYWMASSKSYFYFAVADCTGHGVPGAIMSMLGISLLNEITGEGTIDIPAAKVLKLLREKIISSLHHSNSDNQANDGMDISLIKYIRKSKNIEFAGAFNPLYHFRGGNLTEYKADRMPIGYLENMKPFKNNEFKVKKGDTLYLFSDGYYDQFGGPNDKKFSSKNFRITLTGVVDMPMNKQAQFLEERYYEWKGDNEQLDDIIIAGLKF